MREPKEERELNREKRWIHDMIEAYDNGKTDIQVCKILGISSKQFQDYYNKVPEFRDLVDAGREHCYAYWLDQAQEGMLSKGARDAAFHSAFMQNMFNWTTKSDTRSANIDVNTLSKEDAMKEIAKRLPELQNNPHIMALLNKDDSVIEGEVVSGEE